MAVDLRITPIELRADDTDDQSRQIVGTGVVFHDEKVAGTEYRLYDDMVERITPDAVNRVLSEQQDVRGLYNHDPNQILGRTSSGTMTLRSTKKGLEYVIDPPDTSVGRDVIALLERGDISGSSFAFAARSVVWEETDGVLIRTITDLDMYDIGPVTYPAYEATTAAVRSRRDALMREAREALRNPRAAALRRLYRYKKMKLDLQS